MSIYNHLIATTRMYIYFFLPIIANVRWKDKTQISSTTPKEHTCVCMYMKVSLPPTPVTYICTCSPSRFPRLWNLAQNFNLSAAAQNLQNCTIWGGKAQRSRLSMALGKFSFFSSVQFPFSKSTTLGSLCRASLQFLSAKLHFLGREFQFLAQNLHFLRVEFWAVYLEKFLCKICIFCVQSFDF